MAQQAPVHQQPFRLPPSPSSSRKFDPGRGPNPSSLAPPQQPLDRGRRVSGGSGSSADRFQTPPSSPQRKFDLSPVANTVERKGYSWADNPLYGNTSPEPGLWQPPPVRSPGVVVNPPDFQAGRTHVDTTILDDILKDVEGLAQQDFGEQTPIAASPFKPSNPSSSKKTSPFLGVPHSPRARSVEKMDPHGGLTPLKASYSQEAVYSGNALSRPFRLGSSENLNQVTSFGTPYQQPRRGSQENLRASARFGSHENISPSAGRESPLIGGISTEAPDDTLIKPSKLRASLRSRQARGESPGHRDSPGRGDPFSRNTPLRHSSYNPSSQLGPQSPPQRDPLLSQQNGDAYPYREQPMQRQLSPSRAEINNNFSKSSSAKHTNKLLIREESPSDFTSKSVFYSPPVKKDPFVFQMSPKATSTSSSKSKSPGDQYSFSASHTGSQPQLRFDATAENTPTSKSGLHSRRAHRSQSQPEIDDISSVSIA